MRGERFTSRKRHCKCTRARRFFGEYIVAVNPDCSTHGQRKARHRRWSVITWFGAVRHSVAGLTMLFLFAVISIVAIVTFYEGIIDLIKLTLQE